MLTCKFGFDRTLIMGFDKVWVEMLLVSIASRSLNFRNIKQLWCHCFLMDRFLKEVTFDRESW